MSVSHNNPPGHSRRQALGGIAMVAGTAPLLASESTTQGAGSSRQPAQLSAGVSVLDFGADPSGRNDSSPSFRKALAELGGGTLLVPPGRYLVENIGGLGPAGQKVIGSSRWTTTLTTERGGQPLFANPAAGTGTSAYHLISDLCIDLNDQPLVAIDLASINCSSLERLLITGGAGGAKRGTGIRFAAPLDKGAYDNGVHDCAFENLRVAIQWDKGANNNAVFNPRIINCVTGIHAAPGGLVDTPRIFGGRIEGCEVGILEGAQDAAYLAVRFENNAQADIRFTSSSKRAAVWGGSTASSPISLLDLDQAYSPQIDSADVGHWAIQESAAHPKISTGKHVFARPGKAPVVPAGADFAASFGDDILLLGGAGLTFVGTGVSQRIVCATLVAGPAVAFPAFDRASGAYLPIVLGGGASVHPPAGGVTDLGTAELAYRGLYLTGGLVVNGRRMLTRRAPAIADDNSGTSAGSKVNEILAALRSLGLIER